MSDTSVAVKPCEPADVGVEFTDDAPQALRDALTKYFAVFDAPIVDENAPGGMFGSRLKCSCGKPLAGMFGVFRWGLAHGEGFCGECRRPGRAYHYVRDENGNECMTLRHILLYSLAPDQPAPSAPSAV